MSFFFNCSYDTSCTAISWSRAITAAAPALCPSSINTGSTWLWLLRLWQDSLDLYYHKIHDFAIAMIHHFDIHYRYSGKIPGPILRSLPFCRYQSSLNHRLTILLIAWVFSGSVTGRNWSNNNKCYNSIIDKNMNVMLNFITKLK